MSGWVGQQEYVCERGSGWVVDDKLLLLLIGKRALLLIMQDGNGNTSEQRTRKLFVTVTISLFLIIIIVVIQNTFTTITIRLIPPLWNIKERYISTPPQNPSQLVLKDISQLLLKILLNS